MTRGVSRPIEPSMPDPLAYFLTWATYGTWLPGDERGWIRYQHGWKLPGPTRQMEAEARMSEDACVLDAEQRACVEETITAHCRIRDWQLHAVNCRTNHLHIVVSAGCHPDELRRQFKAWCTRRLRELNQKRSADAPGAGRANWWAERGSRRYLNDEASLEAAILYVQDGQDGH